ncbi:MAG TPA: hypothetical protein VF031_07850 [Alphaproteobacteria bacterium]
MPRALWGVSSALALAVALFGCGGNQEEARPLVIGKSGLDLVSYTGTTRGAYIWPADGGRHVCAEPPPDLGLTTAREISANLKAAAQTLGNIGAPSIDAGGAAKLSSAAIELAGRSQLVLLAREFLYRECELAANFSKDDARYTLLAGQYDKILGVVVTLANADRDRAAAELISAQIEAGKLNEVQDQDIAKIAAHVTRSDGSIDADALKALVAAAQIDPSFKQSIQSRTSLADLIEYLQLVPDQVTQALVTAIPKKG